MGSPPDPATGPAPRSAFRRGVFYAFGVALPVAALGFELLTHGCHQVYFDPLPTWLHAALVAFVPAAALWADGALRRGAGMRGACRAAGFALGVALFYTVLMLPVLPISLLAVLWLGIGLLSFAAPGAALVLAVRGRQLARRLPRGRRELWSFAGLGVVVLLLLEIPGWIVAHGLETGDAELLRRWGTRGALLRAAHDGMARANLTAHLGYDTAFLGLFRIEDAELRRNQTLFYRATGRDPRAVGPPRLVGAPRPQLFGAGRPRDPWGRGAGGALEGLALASSRQDALVFADEAVAYVEWTLVFRNDARWPQEARARLALPPGGVATRASLWVDGRERDAAFGPRAQVREAYERVVSRRRDPLLVTSDRPGEVSIRAFPVPASGGTMRVRVGVTAPLALEEPGRGRLDLPRIAERNFSVDPELEHAVWVDSRDPVVAAPAGLEPEPGPDGVTTVRGRLAAHADDRSLVMARDVRDAEVWVADAVSGDGAVVRQRLEPPGDVRDPRWVVVLDGSRAAGPHAGVVADALEELPAGRLVALIVARDEPLVLVEGDTAAASDGARDPADALDRLRALPFRGGQDNRRALERAWDLASDVEGAAILWLHGPQPVPLEPPDPLVQRLERRPGAVRVVAAPLEPGRNVLLASLPAHLGVALAPHAAGAERLAELLRSGRRARGPRPVRERLDHAPTDAAPVRDAGHPVAVHLTRLWAHDRVQRILRQAPREGREEAAALAARYRVVTAVSGAVVLERDDQYDAAGLDAPRPTSGGPRMLPIPEPGATALLALAALAAGSRLRSGSIRAPSRSVRASRSG